MLIYINIYTYLYITYLYAYISRGKASLGKNNIGGLSKIPRMGFKQKLGSTEKRILY